MCTHKVVTADNGGGNLGVNLCQHLVDGCCGSHDAVSDFRFIISLVFAANACKELIDITDNVLHNETPFTDFPKIP